MKKIFILIAAILLIGGGYYWYKNNTEGQEGQVNDQNQNTEILKKYVSQDSNIQFEYRDEPNGYILSKIEKNAQSDKNLIETLMLMRKVDQGNVPEGGEGPPVINILSFNNPQNLGAKAWADENKNISLINLLRSEAEPRKIGGIDGILYEADGLYASNVAVVTTPSKAYLFIGQFMDQNSEIYEDFFTILDSIKFDL